MAEDAASPGANQKEVDGPHVRQEQYKNEVTQEIEEYRKGMAAEGHNLKELRKAYASGGKPKDLHEPHHKHETVKPKKLPKPDFLGKESEETKEKQHKYKEEAKKEIQETVEAEVAAEGGAKGLAKKWAEGPPKEEKKEKVAISLEKMPSVKNVQQRYTS